MVSLGKHNVYIITDSFIVIATLTYVNNVGTKSNCIVSWLYQCFQRKQTPPPPPFSAAMTLKTRARSPKPN